MAKQTPKDSDSARRKMVIESIVEGRKMEAYAEHRTKEMNTCWICGAICYRKTPGKVIGKRWVCIDCLRQLKEALDTLEQWEEELAMAKDARRQLDGDLGT